MGIESRGPRNLHEQEKLRHASSLRTFLSEVVDGKKLLSFFGCRCYNRVESSFLPCILQVAPLQANQVATIRRMAQEFDLKQSDFRDKFRKCPAFKGDCESPYEYLDKYHFQMHVLATDLEKMSESGTNIE